MNHEENLQKIKSFLESESIPYSVRTDVFDFENPNVHIEEPVFVLNNGSLELRYADSFSHKTDYSKRFGSIQNGIPVGFFTRISKEKKKEGIRVIWIKDYEISENKPVLNPLTGKMMSNYYRRWSVLKSYIMTACGRIKTRIYARDCEVRVVPSKSPNNDVRTFLDYSCFYGYRQASVNLGLYLKKDKNGFHKGDLMFLYSFGFNFYGNRENKTSSVEAIRVATLPNVQIIGGASKCLKHFLDAHPEVKDIIFYVDADHNDSKSLETLGFEFVSWDAKGGFMNLATADIEIPGLKVSKGEVFQRKPMMHKKIMELMSEGKIVSVGTAGTIVYKLKF